MSVSFVLTNTFRQVVPVVSSDDGNNTVVKNPGTGTSAFTSANVSAVVSFSDGTIKSLGTSNYQPYFRGRNLLLEYHDGSPCVDANGNLTGLRMSTLISFKCDHDTAASHAGISFLSSPDNCTFFFEARSVHACPSTNKEQSMAPVPIFLIILGVAVLVYALASILLQPFTSGRKGFSDIKSSKNGKYGKEGSAAGYSDTTGGSYLPLSTHDILGHDGINANNFVFPPSLSFLNPLLYRMRRLRYTPERSSQLSSNGETITVFEALTPNGGAIGSNSSKSLGSTHFRATSQ